MLNTIGLANPGIAAFRRTLPRLADLRLPIWVSVGGFGAEDYADLCGQLDEEPAVATIELNLSCPNVPSRPRPRSSSSRAVAGGDLQAAVRKLSPAVPDIGAVATAAAERGGRRALARQHDARSLARRADAPPPTLDASGGLSGPALKPVALAAVYLCAEAVDLPIVGMGGVSTGRDALELLAAGAAAVALGTMLFSDPGAPARIRAELEPRPQGWVWTTRSERVGWPIGHARISTMHAVEKSERTIFEKAAD